MYQIWRHQKWSEEHIVHYNVRNYSSIYLSNINGLNEAKKHIEMYQQYLNYLQNNSEYLIYAKTDYLYILDVKNKIKIYYYDLNNPDQKNQNIKLFSYSYFYIIHMIYFAFIVCSFKSYNLN